MDSIPQRRRHADGEPDGRSTPPEADDADLETLLSAHDEAGDKEHAGAAAAGSSQAARPAWAVAAALWLLLALLWVRWPVYQRTVFAWLEPRLPGGKQEVEPLVVTAAVTLPFLACGLAFYLREGDTSSPSGSATRRRRGLRLRPRTAARRPLQALYRLRRTLLPTADPVDLLSGAVFLAVQLNLVAGKLLIDRESGKLAKAGVCDRLARALGMNALYCLLLSVLLLARGSFAHRLLGLSAERATRYHVLSGQAGGLLLLLHGAGYVLVWFRAGTLASKLLPCLDPEECTPKQMYGSARNFSGLLALLTWAALALASLETVRRRRFRVFSALHALAAPFLLLSGLHYYPLVFWLAPAALLYAVYRVASLRSRGAAAVLSVDSLSDKVLRLELALGPAAAAPRPGQFVYVQVPAIARREWHPFSVSAAPRHRSAADEPATSLWLDVRVQRGFTRQLLQLARRGELAGVRLDGFYGSHIASSPHMVFVAGGSGMAPFLSALERLVQRGDGDGDGDAPQSVWVIWASRGAELMHAHGELLDAVRQSPRWKGRVWLHVTAADGARDDDDDTEPDDTDSDALTPRVERFRPARSAHDAADAFRGRFDELVGLPLFAGAVAGCALAMAAVYALTSVWYVKRPLLLVAAVGGAALGASVGALYVEARTKAVDGRAYRSVNGSDDLEQDVSRPMTPSTPRAFLSASPGAALARLFKVERGRPDLRALLAAVHSEIQENYGMGARAAVWVSGPPEMQREAVDAARTLRAPSFQVHEKAFVL